ncbi:DUF397 domain-containing protein [Streptomyces sp. NPDC020403]|uniref:DUF397 domain-containing protein n=1 Tax=unclassified Streptomyces TaxID=2593676 RepID=UPI0033FB54FD
MTMNVTDWQKSSYCAQGEACIHVSGSPGAVELTETGDPAGATLRAAPPAWAALVRSIKDADNHG